MKLYVWRNVLSYFAVAHAESVAEARKLLLSHDNIGESGDGSCPERDKARRAVLETTPEIFMGRNAEFALTDSAELREQEDYSQKLFKEKQKAETDNATLRKALEEILPLVGVVVHDDYGKALERIKQARKALAATKPEGETNG